MATPLGHYLVGLSLASALARDAEERARGRWLAAIACVPDLDVIPGLFVGDLARFHHGATHSLLATALFTGAAAGILSWRDGAPAPKLLLLVLMLYASHSLLDAFTLDTAAPYGVPLLWPWTGTTYEFPWMLLPNVQHSREPLVSAHNVLLMAQEAFVFVPLVGLAHVLASSRCAWKRPAVWLYGGWFLVAVAISVASLNSF
jgi:inner membrane protein